MINKIINIYKKFKQSNTINNKTNKASKNLNNKVYKTQKLDISRINS